MSNNGAPTPDYKEIEKRFEEMLKGEHPQEIEYRKEQLPQSFEPYPLSTVLVKPEGKTKFIYFNGVKQGEVLSIKKNKKEFLITYKTPTSNNNTVTLITQ